MQGFLFSLVSPLEIYMMLRGFIPVIVIVVIGILVGRWDLSKHQQTLIKLIHYIFLPCLSFSALHKHAFNLAEVGLIALAVILMTTTMTVVAIVVLNEKFLGASKNVLATVYMSSGTLLPPLAYMLFGNEGLSKALIFHFFVLLAYHTVGIGMLDGKTDLMGFFRKPFIYFVALGMLTKLLPFSLPVSLEEFVWLAEKGIDLVAMGALPVLLISFGYPLGILKRADLSPGLRGGLLRVFAGPAVAFLIIYVYRKTGLMSMDRGYDILEYLDYRTTEALLILGSALPTSHYALNSFQTHSHAKDSSDGTLFISTASSIVTIPIILLFILMFIFTD